MIDDENVAINNLSPSQLPSSLPLQCAIRLIGPRGERAPDARLNLPELCNLGRFCRHSCKREETRDDWARSKQWCQRLGSTYICFPEKINRCCWGGMPSFSSTRSLMRSTLSVGSISISISLPVSVCSIENSGIRRQACKLCRNGLTFTLMSMLAGFLAV